MTYSTSMDTILSNEEIDELKTISDFLNMNDETMQKLGYALYVSKYQDRLSEYITDIKAHNYKLWCGKYLEYTCIFRHYPSNRHHNQYANRLNVAILKLIQDIKWEQTFI